MKIYLKVSQLQYETKHEEPIARRCRSVTVNAEHTARKISSAEADDLPSDLICIVEKL
jgi:hypothetical protein